MIRRLAVALAVALQMVPLLVPSGAAAAEYSMSTVARYVVDPAASEIAVSVEVTFTNTTPNPPGQLSGFDRIDLAVQSGASQVSAKDGKGALTVDLVARDGVQVASVRPRARVRYNHSVSFTLGYRLHDGSAADVHVRSEVIRFAAWAFGTSSDVTVELPGSYEARADGDPMLIATGGEVQRLTSGPIAEPGAWLALITATQPTTYATRSASIALTSGTVDLQVRAWAGDPAWGERTLATLAAALPKLETAIGLPYPRVGPLVVSETVGGEGSADQPLSPTAEMQVAFDADTFTLLHQAAHIWISDQLAADRWIREGLASHEAARVAIDLGAALPYDPAVRAADLAADGFPLVEWDAAQPGAAGDAYAYAASWALVDRLAGLAGEPQLARTLRRVVAGLSAYDPTDPDQLPLGGLRSAPVDTRRLLDQLAMASGVDLPDLFGQIALGPAADAELAERQSARDAYQRLLRSAGDWGAPDPIRNEMAGWRFDAARGAMEVASAWLIDRDAMVARVAKAGLTPPDLLRQRFAAGGGGPDARAELAAEAAVVDAYLDVQTREAASGGLLDSIGLFGADDPRQLLAQAATQFGLGDLQAAAGTLDAAALALSRAPTNGVVRIASAVVLLTVIVLLAGLTARRRGGSHYTASG